MSDHLPECPTCADPMDCIPNGHYPSVSVSGPALCSKVCVCDRLRACEARVREAERTWSAAVLDKGRSLGRGEARDAVAALPCGPLGSSNRFWRDGALAAIDALEDKS